MITISKPSDYLAIVYIVVETKPIERIHSLKRNVCANTHIYIRVLLLGGISMGIRESEPF